MVIKIWGCRGSIPAPGPYTFRYGGNTTCIEIRPAQGKALFIIDAGSGVRSLGKALIHESAVFEIRFLFTHAHWDHLMGFPFFQPAYSDRYTITLCSGIHAQGAIAQLVSHQMTAPYFPVDFRQLKATFNFRCENPTGELDCCLVSGIKCIPFPSNHPNGGQGFKFAENGKTFVFLTDNELDFRHPGGLKREQYVEICRGADLLVHDAQYTDEEYRHTRGWGHSTFENAVNLAVEAGVKVLGLYHHDPDRTDDDQDRQLDHCRNYIQLAGSPVECFACAEGMVIELN